MSELSPEIIELIKLRAIHQSLLAMTSDPGSLVMEILKDEPPFTVRVHRAQPDGTPGARWDVAVRDLLALARLVPSSAFDAIDAPAAPAPEPEPQGLVVIATRTGAFTIPNDPKLVEAVMRILPDDTDALFIPPFSDLLNKVARDEVQEDLTVALNQITAVEQALAEFDEKLFGISRARLQSAMRCLRNLIAGGS